MVSIRPFSCDDLLRFSNINLDPYTETFSSTFYLHYFSKWPELSWSVEAPSFTSVALAKRRQAASNVNTLKTNPNDLPSSPQSDQGNANCNRGNQQFPSLLQMHNQLDDRPPPLMGYMVAKAEGRGNDWHGHVTALSVAPEYRRIGLATRLMLELERVSELKSCHYIDLFVRASNESGLQIYTKLDYVVYRRVLNYYWGKDEDEDALDMRKALSADVDKKSIVTNKKVVQPEDLEHP